MKKKLVFTICILIGFAGPSFAKENIAKQIKQTVIDNLNALQNEDLARMMETIHTQSLSYLTTKQQIVPLMENYELSYKLMSFDFIGLSGYYAICRAKQRTEKISGPAFRNNEIDMIQIFKKEDDKWKFWSQAILYIRYLD
jgi:hypothetical protein